jgi:hypothetical protein
MAAKTERTNTMPTDTIKPRDAAETATLSTGARIAAAIGIIGTAVPALLAAVGGLDWITAHLPLLLTGLGSLVSGGVASWIAVRRMRVDRLAKGAGLAILLLAASALTGCVAIRADGTADGASVWAVGWGADSAANLTGVAVTGPSTNDSTGVSFDSGSSQQQTAAAIQSLITLGAAIAPVLAGRAPAASSGLSDPSDLSDSSDAADPAGFSGAPGPAGEGVYGRPSCPRCAAYRAAHPDVALINIDVESNRADLWAALRLRGFTGSTVSLPVQITADGYTQAAK